MIIKFKYFNPAFIYHRRKAIKLQLYSQLSSILKRWKQWKTDRYFEKLHMKYQGHRGFVIGNGPSLRITDLDCLVNDITIASNKIYLAFNKTKWRPSFYTIADPLVWEKVQSDLHKYCKIVHSPDYFDSQLSSCRVYKWNNLGKAQLINTGKNCSDNLSIGAYCGYTVTFENIQFALHLGLNPIYIIGCDHSYAGEINVIPGQKIIAPDVSNHFLPNYRSPGEIVDVAPIKEMNESYQCAREFCDKKGIKIFNATRGGKLSIFERCDLDTIFTQ